LVNDRTARRIREEAERLGFHPNLSARNLAQGQTRLVALLVPEMTYLMGDYYLKFRFGIEQALAERGYSLVLSAYQEQSRDLFSDLLEKVGVDGAIVVPRRLSEGEIEQLCRAPIRCVVADHAVAKLSSVSIDNYRLGYAMARHLVELGHNRIACLAGTSHWSNAIDRLRGFRACIEEFGFDLPDHYIQYCIFSDAYEAALSRTPLFFSAPYDPGPTAIVAGNDDMAAAVYRFAEQTGRSVPKDISVIGCDNTFYSKYLSPPLTTIDQDAVSLAKRSVAALLDGDPAAGGSVQFRVVVRGSTAPAPRA
jgi:DNA-binding LacI/PurR family transcriptional regulator